MDPPRHPDGQRSDVEQEMPVVIHTNTIINPWAMTITVSICLMGLIESTY